jgi:membrane protein required for colicin V production
MMAVELLEPGARALGSLSTADLIIVGIVLAAAAIGFWLGLIWMLVLSASMVACIWVTLVYHPVVAGALGAHFTESVRLMASAAAVFVGALMVCYLVAYLFREIISAMRPQLTDRILGAIFGVLLGVLVSAFFSFLVLEYADPKAPVRPRVEQSVIARALGASFQYALPDSLRRAVVGPSGKDGD